MCENNSHSQARSWNLRPLLELLAAYPIPSIALAGLLAGAVLRLGFGQPQAADWVWLATLVVGGAPLVWDTLRGMLRGNFASDVVAMLAIVVALAMGEYFAGVLVVLMQSGGEALEAYGLRRAGSSLEQLLARAPRSAWRRSDQRLEQIAAAEVAVGDELLIRTGDLLPVDGTLLSRRADVDESALTGEPLGAPKRRGDALLSGSVNAGPAFAMRADRVADESQYARIVHLVRAAQDDKPPIQRLADRYAVWFTPLTLLVCALGWWLTGDARTILSVLVVATPCPLILATPIAIIGGINRMARAGIVVRGGAAIEQVGNARAVVFDKTGTLTYGTPTLEDVVMLDGVVAPELLRLAGSVEQASQHVLGRAMVESARSDGPLSVPSHVREVPGRGIGAVVDGRSVLVGSRRFVEEQLPATFAAPVTSDMPAAYVALDGIPAGVVRFRDRLRPGVERMIERLRAYGVRRTVMLTGDGAEHAAAIAREAGVDEWQADLLPEQKVAALHRLARTYTPLVMVGDGINDAPALATATVGVAMGARGTGISAEAADIVLLVDDVTLVADAVQIGKRTIRVAKQSILVGLGLSLLLMAVAAAGLIPPPVGALCQELVDVAVILNALRAK